MREICIHLPPMGAEDTIELELTLNGRKHLMSYRVETIEGGRRDKISRLRRFIESYDPEWELVQIGSPGDDHVALMFRRKEDAVPVTSS